MDRKSELYAMWNIQEQLLQHYRTFAITLLSIICASIFLYLIKYYGDILQPHFGITNDRGWVNLIGFVILVILHVMAFSSNTYFKDMCKTRAELVTLFQNMLIAEENKKLSELLKKHGIPKDTSLVTLIRNKDGKARILPFELVQGNYKGFFEEIMVPKRENYNTYKRYTSSRLFLQFQMFPIFYMMFTITAILSTIFLIRYLNFYIHVGFNTHGS